jgi:hypothetical protein
MRSRSDFRFTTDRVAVTARSLQQRAYSRVQTLELRKRGAARVLRNFWPSSGDWLVPRWKGISYGRCVDIPVDGHLPEMDIQMKRSGLTLAIGSSAVALGIATAALIIPQSSSAAASIAQKKQPTSTKKPAATAKKSSKGAVDPNAPEVVAPGDIPDDQLFVPYQPSGGGYTINVPEGWSRTEKDGAVIFTDKYNSIMVTSSTVTEAPSIDSVRSSGLADVSQDPSYKAGKIATAKTAGGSAIKATYEIGSAANKVTGKKALLAVERYVYFRNGTQVVVTLSGAKGADNVDPWKTVSDSVRIGSAK